MLIFNRKIKDLTDKHLHLFSINIGGGEIPRFCNKSFINPMPKTIVLFVFL
jgi:hypothetical protein